ncbi:MAG: discoidin domain-containing protein [Verrucomicrobia bacterium]|nr:discoidin domain-containing protein [Verrucomicrobiota bacterium]
MKLRCFAVAFLFALPLCAGDVKPPSESGPAAVTIAGGLTLRFPSLKDVSPRQTLDVYHAEVRAFVGAVEIRSMTPRGNPSLSISDIINKGAAPVAVEIESVPQQSVTVAPGQMARVLFDVSTKKIVAALPEADKLIADHRQWWDAHWRKSFLRLDAEPLLERMWSVSMYVIGSSQSPSKPSADPLEAAIRTINRWIQTRDLEWIKKQYPPLRDLADKWDERLEKNKETWGDNNYRYVVAGEPFNPISALAALRRFYQGMIEVTCDLDIAGFATGRTGVHLARWEDFLARLSEYPMSHAYGRKVFAWSEDTLHPFLRAQASVLFPVFPAEQITLSSDPRLLATARNTLAVKPQYYVESPEIFVIAARLAHHPPEIVERFNHHFRATFLPDLATAEAVVEAIHGMLLHSHEGFLRLFPCWHHPNAAFAALPAAGGFLVSAEKRNGVCQSFTVRSEKGRPCGVLNPWPGRTLTVNGIELEVENRRFGQLCLFPTEPGKLYTIAAKEPLPASLPLRNAALYKPVTASSNHQPATEKDNWNASKLTDGARINTRAGHRGWSSALLDNPEAAEWVQIDLNGVMPVNAVNLWPLDHGDAWQHTDGSEPFVRSDEIDQSYDGFPVDFRILVSTDGKKWDEVAKRQNFRKPAAGPETSDLKPADVTGPEQFKFGARPVRYVKLEVTKLRRTRAFAKHAACLAEIEVLRSDVP